MRSGQNITALVVLILAGESIFMLPFVLARIFRPTMLEVLHVTNLQLGTAFSIYGLVAMGSYFFGGPLADRYSARKLIAMALWATALGGVALALNPSVFGLYLIYGYWGFTTIFLFWAAMIRATREWGAQDFQGRAFGFLEGGRGLTSALIGAAGMLLFAQMMGDSYDPVKHDRDAAYRWTVLLTAAIVAGVGVLAWWLIPSTKNGEREEQDLISLDRLRSVLNLPTVWLQGAIIVCAYVGYKTTDDFSLYAKEVLGFDEVGSAQVGSTMLWLRPVFAVLAGVLADRWKATGVISTCFALMVAGGTLLWLGLVESAIVPLIITAVATLAGVYGLRGVYFAIIGEAKVPWAATGTAVGIMSVIGYTPDVFMSPLMGYLLDAHPGAAGHRLVFLVFTAFAAAGLLLSWAFARISARVH